MIMHILSINLKHLFTYSRDIHPNLHLQWQLFSEVLRVPGIMFEDKGEKKKHLCDSSIQ